MQVAPLPANEISRVVNLSWYGVMDSEEEKDYDDLTELTALVCNCPHALISFIDKDRQWFKSRKNMALKETPRNSTFCAHTILQNEVMVVPDTKKDIRFFDNSFVTEGYKIAFYAGAPIISPAGFRIGTVCVFDNKTRADFSAKQKNALQIIARQVTALLELKVKTKLIAEQPKMTVAEGKRIAELTLSRQDEEKSYIANELHENFAQTLAATNLYLDFAERSKESSIDFIQKSKTNILQIIKDIKALSKSMLPSTFQNANYAGFIKEMLNEYGQLHDVKISFRHQGKSDCYDANIGLTLFRIIQYQLKNASNCGAKKISIKIKTSDVTKVSIVDDGKKADAFEPERMMLLHHIETRIRSIKGNMGVGFDKKGHNLLAIDIPLSSM
ncbi:MAG: GAF domain-containing protein [Ferruginibacter sp.]